MGLAENNWRVCVAMRQQPKDISMTTAVSVSAWQRNVNNRNGSIAIVYERSMLTGKLDAVGEIVLPRPACNVTFLVPDNLPGMGSNGGAWVMLLAFIAGWLTKRIWPNGVIIVILISVIWSAIGYLRDSQINSTSGFLGEPSVENGYFVIFLGLIVDIIVNLIIFAAAWFLRRRFRPHGDQ